VKLIESSSRSTRPRRLERASNLETFRDEWEELTAASGNVFSTWEWAETWWRHFGAGRTARITAVRNSDGNISAILPLYRARRGSLRILRFIGHGEADELGPVCRLIERPKTIPFLAQALEDEEFDLFIGEELPGNEDWVSVLGGKVLRRGPSPVLRADGTTFEELLKMNSRNFRSQVRRKERRLREEHDVRFRLCNSSERLQQDLDILFRLHAERWHQRGSSFGVGSEMFHRDFAAAALRRGWLRLWTLELDGQPAAAWYGFRFNGVESYYQSGRDPAWNQLSLGFVLLCHTIREALEDGVSEYRFLRGGEPYKYRFANADPGLQVVAVGNGVPGRAAVAVAGVLAQTRLRSLVRQMAG
jgi:CelD/BcsL family acetyltransferase involved in cellulose biosynthesis